MPQGAARERLLRDAKLGLSVPAGDVLLLERSGGAPIGNLRIREAVDLEVSRLGAAEYPGLAMRDILERTDPFLEIADRFAYVASGSSGVAGDWPKFLCTKTVRGEWLPDSLVPDDQAIDHMIIKLLRSDQREAALILESEAPYLKVARQFGLRVGRDLTYAPGLLMMPRFDRCVVKGEVVRYGQESLVSALGIAEFGHVAKHEDYLAIIKRIASDPAAEIVEYVRRDVLNMAMGNTDNHGRNTALQKLDDGTIRLTPLFDFNPMRIDQRTIPRSTKWACLANEALPNWRLVCEAAAEGTMLPGALMTEIVKMEPLLRKVEVLARDAGVPEEVVVRACNRALEIADSVAELKGRLDA